MMCHPITPSIPPVPAELDAMARAWPSLADSHLAPCVGSYERAKLDFYAMRSRIAAGKAVLL